MTSLREDARAIFDAAVRAADPGACVRRALEGRRFDGPVTVVGAGKAVVSMARAVEQALPGVQGVVATKRGHAGPTRRIRVLEAGHPVPDEAGVRAARAVLDSLGDLPVICLLSGGGSALLTLPAEGLTLSDKQRTTELLLRSGATIDDLNCVRKHLSGIKGGRLARAARSPVLTLALSDVVGDRIDVIASGPTAPDPTTRDDARRVVRERGVERELPAAVRHHLDSGTETLKPGDSAFSKVDNIVIGNNRLALDAAASEARRRGYDVQVLTATLQGEAREAGRTLVQEARRFSGRVCLLAGGETTVTVRGPGTGGRCQELALAAAIEMKGEEGITLLAAGTDGADGPTEAAGAVVDGTTATEDAARFLEANDSHAYFARQGGRIVTGPTGTNVMDVVVILRETLTGGAPSLAWATGGDS